MLQILRPSRPQLLRISHNLHVYSLCQLHFIITIVLQVVCAWKNLQKHQQSTCHENMAPRISILGVLETVVAGLCVATMTAPVIENSILWPLKRVWIPLSPLQCSCQRPQPDVHHWASFAVPVVPLRVPIINGGLFHRGVLYHALPMLGTADTVHYQVVDSQKPFVVPLSICLLQNL